jgi:pyrroloquinoline quinone biosynthesis protein E
MRLHEAARRGARLVQAKLAGRLVPLHVVLTVTARCNLRCVYCSCPSRRDEELTADEWCRVLDECRALGTERVQFFGGEPLLRTDLAAIAAHARRLGLHCVLATNGVLVPKRGDVVRRMHTVVLSLDGEETAHDANRGRHSHALTLEAIAAARAWNVPVKVNAVLNVNNADQLDWLVAFTREQRIPISLNVMRSGSADLWNEAERHRLGDAPMRALLDRIIQVKQRNRHVLFSDSTYEILRGWPDFTRDRLTLGEGGGRVGQPRCSAGRLHCTIYSDGRLFPCALTIRQLPALDVRRVGVAAALEAASRHTCASCASACMLEKNRLFALDPRVVATLARAYLSRDMV